MSRAKKVGVTVAAVGLVGSAAALAVTDLRGRTEVHATDSKIAAVDHELEATRDHLAGAREQADLVGAQVRAVATGAFQTQTNVDGTEAAVTATEQGLFFDGIGISQLNTCLSGVVLALDQVAVGQNQGALWALGSVSGNCSSVGVRGG